MIGAELQVLDNAGRPLRVGDTHVAHRSRRTMVEPLSPLLVNRIRLPPEERDKDGDDFRAPPATLADMGYAVTRKEKM